MIAYLVYVLVRAFIFLLGILPENISYSVGRMLGNIGYLCDFRHRKVSIDNIKTAFPSKRGFEVKQLARKSFTHFGMSLVDFSKLSRYGIDWFYSRSEMLNSGPTYEYVKKMDKGALLLLSHFGVWEVLGTLGKKEKVEINAIARPLSNKYLNNHIKSLREKFPVKIIDKMGAVSIASELLNKKKLVGILADQRAGGRGVFVDFFGTKASTVATPAVLAIKTGTLMYPIFGIRVSPGRFRLYVKDRIKVESVTGEFDEKVFKITQLYASIVEEEVKKHPEQYFWMHRRWKSVPRKGALMKEGRVK